MERRAILKAAASSALAGAAGLGVTQSGDAAATPQPSGSQTITGKKFRMNRPYRVIVNEDGGRGGRNYVAPLTAEQYLRAVFEVQVENKPVDAVFWCGLQNPAGGAWYDTKVGEVGGSMFWPQIKETWEWGPMKTRDELIKQGLDPLTLVCDRGHELGKDIWLSFRANDTHHVWNRNYVGSKMTRKYKERPDLCVGPDHGRKEHATFAPFQWDYNKKEVRDDVLALLTEAFMDYDIDGVEIDFMRVVYLFAKSNTVEGVKKFNDLMRSIREVADRAEQKKGRPQGIAVRIPSYEPACEECGYDWRTWVSEGLIDVLTASTHQPLEQEADLKPYIDGCKDTGTLVNFCLESSTAAPRVHYNRGQVHLYGGTPDGPATEDFRSMALGAYQQGADGVYFFNLHFPFERFDTHPNLEFLTEMHDWQLMAERDQRYIVSYESPKYSSHWFFECAPPKPTPHWITREAPEHSFHITVGADIKKADSEKRLRAAKLRLCIENLTPPDVIEVLWNGEPLAGEFEPPIEPGTWQHWFCVHFFVADLAKLGLAPEPGKQTITLRLKHRNPEIGEGILLHSAEFDVRFWHKPGMPHAVNELPGMFR